MVKKIMENEPTNTEELYLLSKKMRKDSIGFYFSLLACIALIGIMGLFTWAFYDDVGQFGTIIEVKYEECGANAELFQIDGQDYCHQFQPYSDTIPIEVIELMYTTRNLMQGWLWLLIGLTAAPLFYSYFRTRSTKNKIDEVLDDFIRDSYFLNVELTKPEGRDKNEKFFNLLSTVYPEIKYNLSTKKFDDVSDNKVKGYNDSFTIKTGVGEKGVIFLDKLEKFEDLKKMAKDLSSDYPPPDNRIIIVAKEFSEDIDSDEIETKMEEFMYVIHIDLIKETKSGYSIVWID